LIVFLSGVGPGSIVVEAGTGSGFLTAALAYYVRPDGRVYSYEIRRDFLEIARKNLSLCGLLPYVDLKHKDIVDGIDEKNVDAVILDMPNPWDVVPHAKEALKDGGVFVSFLPTINQVEKIVEKLIHENFLDVLTIETLLRKIKVKKGETRPETFMIGHTGYIVFARKP
ncbi:MAG TPA: methyltransferase domain-containing protein, partial [Thermoprotei archaeon]|nr:methyltransferase domain-containing protein [Thermoprotei archaeon]